MNWRRDVRKSGVTATQRIAHRAYARRAAVTSRAQRHQQRAAPLRRYRPLATRSYIASPLPLRAPSRARAAPAPLYLDVVYILSFINQS